MGKEERPWKICRVGGRTFKIYRRYDALLKQDIAIYPDFQGYPEYTAEGRPFATATDEGCVHGRPQDPACTQPGGYDTYGDCGGCRYFSREETPWDIIGVCLCEQNRRI